MFSTRLHRDVIALVEGGGFVHTTCGGDSPMKTGPKKTYAQSTGTTTTTTLLNL